MKLDNKGPLSKKDKEIVEEVGAKRITFNSLKIYNNLCIKCKVKIMRKPKLKFNQYCEKCQALVKEIWKDYI